MAAKLKTKKDLPISTTAKEVSPGLWEFSTDRFTWRYQEGYGINLSVRHREKTAEEFTGQLYAKDLKGAVYFAWGFDCGFKYGSPKEGESYANVAAGVVCKCDEAGTFCPAHGRQLANP